MAIAVDQSVIASALWPQGDARDPLGVWGLRRGITGDASGGGIKVAGLEVADKKGGYVYTCYSAQISQLSGANPSAGLMKIRLLTLWPNIDLTAGVQAFSSFLITGFDTSTNFTAPIAGPGGAFGPVLISPNDRFLLLFDPRQFGALGAIIELELGDNKDGALYSFEAYGYFWDRSTLQAPGGPRHPGSS